MAGKIPREFIDDLLVRVDIVDLIDSLVPLKKAGNSYKARCPFHTENSPSFSVNRNKQFYHCFGCGAGGNAISFLMEFSHLDFVEAIEDLAGFVGVDVPREAVEYQGNKQDYHALYSILEQVAIFYVNQLREPSVGAIAIDYLKARGLGGDVAKEFSLGYASDDWSALSSQFDQKLLIDAGMVVSKENGRVYDRFRGRLMFPIRDKRKRIVGFGGRVLDDSLPKYLNSPETAVFSKGNELYGLYELLEKDARPERIIIVEGYMDVLALAQAGIAYSVAALGTATSKTHLDLLFRFSSELVFCFDGDSAGRKAAWRATEASFPCLKDGRMIKIMLLPEGLDPDSLVQEQGVNEFKLRVQQSASLSDYFFETLCQNQDLTTLEAKSLLAAKAKPHIEKIPAGFFREMMLSELGSRLSESSLDILKIPATLEPKSEKTNVSGLIITPERAVLALLLQNPAWIEVIEELSPDWEQLNFSSKEWLLDLVQTIDENHCENTGRLLEIYRGDEKREKMLVMLANLEVIPGENIEFDGRAEFRGALLRVLEQGKKQHLDDLRDRKISEK